MNARASRRQFITLFGGAAAAWPLAAHAQQAPPMIGFLGPASASAMSAWTAAFVQRLRELGWIEGRTIRIEYRWGDGRADRLPEIAAEFVRLKVDVIVTTGTAVPVLKEATSTIPIVFTIANDPVGAGLVRSLARPGGNVTGLSQLAADLGGKRVELLRVMAAGHAAAPLTSVMKSRRFTRSPRRRARAGKTAWSGLEPWQSSY
jgi:putative tryptophan/tyrosine transport system substrate-binding protein